MPPIAGLVAECHLGNIAQRRFPTGDQHIATLKEIGADVAHLSHLPVGGKEAFRLRLVCTEPNNHTMHGSLLACLTAPLECLVGKIDMYVIILHQHLPQDRDLGTLADAVGGEKARLRMGLLHQLGGFLVPAAHIIEILHILDAPKQTLHVPFLLTALRHHPRPHKRGITHDVVKTDIYPDERFVANMLVICHQVNLIVDDGFACHYTLLIGNEVCIPGINGRLVLRDIYHVPIHLQSISLADVGITFQR